MRARVGPRVRLGHDGESPPTTPLFSHAEADSHIAAMVPAWIIQATDFRKVFRRSGIGAGTGCAKRLTRGLRSSSGFRAAAACPLHRRNIAYALGIPGAPSAGLRV